AATRDHRALRRAPGGGGTRRGAPPLLWWRAASAAPISVPSCGPPFEIPAVGVRVASPRVGAGQNRRRASPLRPRAGSDVASRGGLREGLVGHAAFFLFDN
ncbi:hypothetical protein TraAM80_10202, partial [Trypanosoma rangeli]